MKLIDRLMGLKGRNAVVTGAASGIGQSIATFLADAGANVILADRDMAGLAVVIEELSRAKYQARALLLDVAEERSVKEAFDDIGRNEGQLNILVNCAGIYPTMSLTEMAVELWDFVQVVNLRGPMLCMRESIGLLRSAPGATIVNVSSIDSLRPSFPGLAPYGASKAGLNALTRSAAIEFSEYGLRVNAVLPGGIRTPGFAKASVGVDPAVVDASARLLPLKRLGEPMDVAALVHFLVSDASSFITGQTFVVDGGMAIKA
jgi:NAD(P)-dependent dehydrogenase (short-subunit alcohol dehydrogenase family)